MEFEESDDIVLVDCANFTNTTNVNDESCTGTVGEL
jgi:hypothetical protein